MKTELKFKFLQHLNRKKQNEGFTLLELLIVIIILGILAAIGLPSLLNQTAKAKQAEAKQNVGVVNRAQTAYRTENTAFASSFDVLGIGILTGSTSSTTTNYSYTIAGGSDTATIAATARDTALKAYSGGNSRIDEVISSLVCEAPSPGTTPPLTPAVSTTAAPPCPPNYNDLSK
ncbi:MAG: type IV pilin-like G/H family protein [Aphanothece sp. CMT-3BRIN-NPC111]|jgi:type IV pilus assembly protein PilA|nr:type IV pilin-like G/H family protein [Aphanothece sp. CMT-3BRIN-NPC111]